MKLLRVSDKLAHLADYYIKDMYTIKLFKGEWCVCKQYKSLRSGSKFKSFDEAVEYAISELRKCKLKFTFSRTQKDYSRVFSHSKQVYLNGLHIGEFRKFRQIDDRLPKNCWDYKDDSGFVVFIRSNLSKTKHRTIEHLKEIYKPKFK